MAIVVNPLILALDTTQEHGSVALYRGSESLECREVSAPQGFSRVIFDHIQGVLAAHGAAIRDIDLYAVAAGPGSFTGVRVGLAAAKALAKVHGKLVAPVSNLAALAALAWAEWDRRPGPPAGQGGSGEPAGVDACPTAWPTAWPAPDAPRVLVPILDARRREVYAGVYERIVEPRETGEPAGCKALAEDLVISPVRLEERLRDLNLSEDQMAYCGPDVEKLDLHASRRLVTGRVLAGAVAQLALAAWMAGQAQPPEDVDANYVRRSDAEIFGKPWL